MKNLKQLFYLLAILGVTMSLTSCDGFGTISPSAKQYAVESDAFNGEMTVHTGPGVKDWTNFFDDVSYYDKVGGFDFEGSPISIRFANNNIAFLTGHINYRLPTGAEDSLMIDIEEEYEGEARVKSELIRNSMEKAAFNAGQFMTVFDALGKNRSYLQELIFDQANYGQYQVTFKENTIIDQATGKEQVVKVSDRVACKPDSISGVLPRGCVAGYLRTEESALRLYGIELFNFTVKNLKGEQKVEEAIAANLIRSNKMEELNIQARESQVRAATIAEDAKASVAGKQAEKDIAVAEAEKATAVAEERLKQEKFSADAILYSKKKEAEADALKVEAGLSPERAAYWRFKTDSVVSANAAKAPVPEFIMSGGTGNSSTLENMYGMERALILQRELNKGN